MDRATAEALVLEHANAGRRLPDEELVLVDSSTVEKPYGWVFQLQSRAYVETGDCFSMLVGQGPTIVLHDGSIHTRGSAHPPDEEIHDFETAHGLPTSASARQGPRGEPIWVGAAGGDDRLPVVTLASTGLIVARLSAGDVEHLVEHGAAYLVHRRCTVVPPDRITGVRAHRQAGLKIARRRRAGLTVRFATPADRDRVLTELHRRLGLEPPRGRRRRPGPLS